MDGRALLAHRRLRGLAVAATALDSAGWTLAKPVLLNPCRTATTPALSAVPWLAQVWQGLDPQQAWDGHVQLAGVDDSDVVIGPQLDSCLHPVQYGQRRLSMNAGGGAHGPAVDNFAVFTRLMDERRSRGLLFGDVSAIMLRNRSVEVVKTLLRRNDWHDRLLNGSDHPIPGILPLIAPAALARPGCCPRGTVDDLVRLREHNPLLFDLALKRLVRWRELRFAASVFHTRSFFQKHA